MEVNHPQAGEEGSAGRVETSVSHEWFADGGGQHVQGETGFIRQRMMKMEKRRASEEAHGCGEGGRAEGWSD